MAKSINTLRTALILIDIQEGFNNRSFWGASRSNPAFEQNVPKLLAAFRQHPSALVIHIYHTSLVPDMPLTRGADGVKFMSIATPQPDSSEIIVSKTVNSSFIATSLEEVLRAHAVQQLVICGLTVDHCVSTTTRMAANLGWRSAPGSTLGYVAGGNVVLVGDACATFDRGKHDAETVHEITLASLDGEFADVQNTDQVIEALFSARLGL